MTYYECTPGESYTIVPIGRPMGLSRIYILDTHQNPVPPLVKGEIYIGGLAVARGYWRKEKETESAFIDSPFVAGERLYRTGDIARFRRDGNVEFLGRADTQVKVRGYRIELGEIKHTLERHPAVREAVATVGKVANGEDRIVVYVVGQADSEPITLERVREFLANHLPDYMLPNACINLDEIPLTASDKTDFAALPAPGADVFTSKQLYEPPKDDVERLLMTIWGALLPVSRISRTDDFFALGGHSLLATQVASRIRRDLRVKVELRKIFENPVLCDLSDVVRNAEEADDAANDAPIMRLPRRGSDTPLEEK